MIVTAYFKNIKAEFAAVMDTPQLMAYDPFVATVNSNSNYEEYWMPLTGGGVHKLLDTVKFDELSDRSMTIVNEPYYGAIQENRYTIEDTKETLGGNVQMQINKIVNDWDSYQVTLIDNLIADNGNAFDGQAFFSTANRTAIADTLSTRGVINQLSGGGTTTTLILDDIGTAKTALLGFRNKAGRYFNDPNGRQLYIMCGVPLEDKFRMIKDSPTLVNGAGTVIPNPYKGQFEIKLYSTPTTNSNWILLNANAPVKPWILQKREEPAWHIHDDEREKTIGFYWKARIGAGYGNIFSAYRVTNS